MSFNPEKLAKLVSKGAEQVRTGGKGSVRRKHKVVRKATVQDDKKLRTVLNKLQVRDIPAIEEVNMFMDNGSILHFAQPKVQANITANTYVVMGLSENKSLQELLPGILSQMGPENVDQLKQLYSAFSASGAAAAGGDDDVPDLVENFEDVANKTAAQ